MRYRTLVALLLLLACTAAGAQVLKCDRRQGWTMDGEFCARCDLGCPDTKSDHPAAGGSVHAIGACGILSPAPRLAMPAEQMPVMLRIDDVAIKDAARRYPIAATFLAVMASRPDAPNVFDAASVTLGLRHRPRPDTAAAFIERGDEAMQAPLVTELPLFEHVVVEARGERSDSGAIEWWVLSSLETRQGSRVLEGPVRIVLIDSGSRVSSSIGNMGVLAPVMTLGVVE